MMREVIARAIRDFMREEGALFEDEILPSDYLAMATGEGVSETALAQAAIDAISDAGFVIVPKEATEAMIEAGHNASARLFNLTEWYSKVYRAMIVASQPASEQPKPQDP